MRRFIRFSIARLTANNIGQRLMERFAARSLWYLGVGSGWDASQSGESVLIEKMYEVRRSGDPKLCIFDVGANQGQFLSVIRKGLDNCPLEIHSFEPSSHTYQLLSSRFSGIPGVKLNQFALGAREGTATLFSDELASGLASMTQRRLTHANVELSIAEPINVETVDGYCRKHAVEQIHLLKLDVEGHELDVLQGATQMLGEGRISMVSFEFGGCHVDTRTFLKDFWYFFQSYGMRTIGRITPSGFVRSLGEYSEVYEQFLTTNYLVEFGPGISNPRHP